MNTDALLRPKRLDSFIGQKAVVKQLKTVVRAARISRSPVGHLLLSGPAGTGKTSLAYVIAAEMQVPVWATVGNSLTAQLQDYDSLFGDKGLLRALEKGGVIFIDECHNLPPQTQDVLLPWLEQSLLSIRYRAPGAGKGFRKGDWLAHTGTTEPHTVICASTMIGKLSKPLRDRFKMELKLEFYNTEDLFQISRRTARLLELRVSGLALDLVSKRSKGVPRLANRHLWFFQQHQIASGNYIDVEEAKSIMHDLGIDSMGLNKTDRKLLSYLVELDRPAGATTLCAYLSIHRSTLENMMEPSLLQMKLIAKTGRGRIATKKAAQHLRNPFDKGA